MTKDEPAARPGRSTRMTHPPIRNLPLLACLLAVLPGCMAVRRVHPPAYTGPTQTMEDVVAEINRNNLPIRTLWARHSYAALIYDQKGKSHQFSGDGYLLFRKPEDLLLTANVVTEKAFEIGSNAERYWFTVPREERMWWGEKANFDPNKAKDIPIRPDLLIDVLGVLDVDTNFKQPPVPVMRFNNDADAYMFTWNIPLADRWIAVKEVWYDRQTKLPKTILLFDENGRVVVRAWLTKHQAVAGQRGQIASQFELYFPENKSQLSFHLTEIRPNLQKGRVTIPNDASFAFPEEPGVANLIEIK